MAGEVDVVAAIPGVAVAAVGGGLNNGDIDDPTESLSSRTRFEPTRATEDAD